MDSRTKKRIGAFVMVGLFVLPLIAGALVSVTDDGGSTTADTLPLADAPPVTQASDLPPIGLEELPVEAVDTLQLIAQGGPFPYDRDGTTFQNREGLLPPHPEGYYREYTVITPGENDRGARRLVIGEANEVYYTDDHYESFRELVLG